MILADENIPYSIVESLREKGVDVLSVYETYRGATDKQIIELSKNPPRIILTEDKDFGEWVFAHGADSISVIFLRYTYPEMLTISEILVNLIVQKEPELLGMFVTITKDKIRYRTI